ncbi:hypothetical protein C7441_114129 [Pseudaminobacter salicylatoxidans]|uniref:Uncharacterized protein n=1 Tax=Pseudaminobacter salicylatoxidans TaxID=93369 RepID=A0A316C0C1_PSESE|nr:hypothetical protein [Pseudaminobacter salicylatoxidans]PWJ79851.1 hypothetical protein C7441_114129 [Pseudaminobacter salicylatoxidans]
MRVYLAFGAAVAVIAALSFSHWQAYRAGRAVEQAVFTQQIVKENTDAANTAEKWRDALRRCNDAGGMYDFAAGACDR